MNPLTYMPMFCDTNILITVLEEPKSALALMLEQNKNLVYTETAAQEFAKNRPAAKVPAMFRASNSEITITRKKRGFSLAEERCGGNGSLYAVHNDVLLTFEASLMSYRSFRKPAFHPILLTNNADLWKGTIK